MGTYTIPLKRVIELTGGTTDFVNGNTVMTGGNIGLAHYPLFDANYRATLNGKIIDRYWNREIGLETIDMFQLAMRRKMNEIMPYYNKIYQSELIDYTALSTVNIRSTGIAGATQSSDSLTNSGNTANNTTASNGKSDSVAAGLASARSRSVASETPQTMLSGNADYATSANDVTSDSDNSSTGGQISSDSATNNTVGSATIDSAENATNSSNTENSTTGYQGAASDLIIRYRDSLINIDIRILDELEELFMLVWDNSDTYSENGYYR